MHSMHHDISSWLPRGMRLAAAATLSLLTLSSCKAEEETQGPRPRLVVSVSPTWLDGSSSATTEVLVTAVDATAHVGTGSVLLRARAGVFANGAGEETLALQDGSARTTFRCIVAENPLCVGPMPIRAEWNGVRGSATVELPGAESSGGVPVPGTGGSLPAGTSTFSRERVYLWGTLITGTSDVDAIAPVDDPSAVSLGGPAYGPFGQHMLAIRPLDGALFYIGSEELLDRTLRRFVAEGLRFDRERDLYVYPSDPIDNDPVQSTPACPGSVAEVRTTPDSETVYYECLGPDTGLTRMYPVGSSEPFQPAYFADGTYRRVLALGYGGRALVYEGGVTTPGGRLLQADGSVTPITGEVPPTYNHSLMGVATLVRALPDAFLVASREGRSDAPFELYRIAYDGVSSRLGTHGVLPAGTIDDNNSLIRMDLDGALYVLARSPTLTPRRAIQRVPLQPGTPEIVYDEGTFPQQRWTTPVRLFAYTHTNTVFTAP